ncbi:MAG: vancomycin high temperature exclusion protein [Anaerolineales bacterium]
MPLRRFGCWILVGVMLLGAGLIALPFGLRAYTTSRYGAQIYSLDNVPEGRVAVVFGARVLSNGRLSTMLYDRVATAVDLYHAGKVDALLMTGDNRDPSYDEPGAMRRYAISQGVPPEAILTDAYGLRTYDSCYRAREVFGLEAATLVTQEFHLHRALLLCNELGVAAIGVAADYQRPNGYSERAMRWQNWREVGATLVAYTDLLRRRNPTVSTSATVAAPARD